MVQRNRQSLNKLIEQLTENLPTKIRDAFRAAIQDVVDNVQLQHLADLIEAQDYTGAFRALGMSDAALEPVKAALADVYAVGGRAVAATFPRAALTAAKTVFRFNVSNPRAESWLTEESSRLITNLQEDARVAVRDVMQVGLAEGNNPRDVALDIVGRVNQATGAREGGIIGLAQNQQLWVQNARRDLMNGDFTQYLARTRRDKRFDSVVQSALDNGKPLPQATIDKLITRYKASLLQLRGETIARTETIQGLNKATHESMQQALEEGALTSDMITKVWDSAGDDRVRETHAEMDGQEKLMDEPFVTPEGTLMMHPGDWSLGAGAAEIINCRCKVRWNIDWISQLGEGD